MKLSSFWPGPAFSLSKNSCGGSDNFVLDIRQPPFRAGISVVVRIMPDKPSLLSQMKHLEPQDQHLQLALLDPQIMPSRRLPQESSTPSPLRRMTSPDRLQEPHIKVTALH